MKLLFKMKNGGKEELTMDEARELYNELHQIFGAKPAPSPWPYIKELNPLDVYGPIISNTPVLKGAWPSTLTTDAGKAKDACKWPNR